MLKFDWKKTQTFTWNVLMAAFIKDSMRKIFDVSFLALCGLSLNEQIYSKKLLLFRNGALSQVCSFKLKLLSF